MTFLGCVFIWKNIIIFVSIWLFGNLLSREKETRLFCADKFSGTMKRRKLALREFLFQPYLTVNMILAFHVHLTVNFDTSLPPKVDNKCDACLPSLFDWIFFLSPHLTVTDADPPSFRFNFQGFLPSGPRSVQLRSQRVDCPAVQESTKVGGDKHNGHN